MKIVGLLNKINICEKIVNNHQVSDCYCNSKIVIDNSIFVCIKGPYFDGIEFVEEAIKKGAKTIIFEGDVAQNHEGINYIKVDNTKKIYSLLNNVLFKHITSKMKIIGVTGTNGKTTVTTLIYNFLAYKGVASIYIGTNVIEYLGHKYKTPNTTPDIKLMLSHIKNAYQKKIRYLVMEVSSIAVKELRTLGFHYDVFALTNINQDHLDYHLNMEDYKYSKLISTFFLHNKSKCGLVSNKDDSSYQLFTSFYEGKCVSYGIKNQADIMATDINITMHEQNFKIDKVIINSYLIGLFNTYNILCLAGVTRILGYSLLELKDFLKYFYNVPGRMNIFALKDKTIIIDYAHTPSSVENILKTVSNFDHHRIIVVIGAGGNRDKEKRPLIGQILTKYCDIIILTNDNPRDEDERQIAMDLASGIDKEYVLILDRQKAIAHAVSIALKDDIIVILGKGIEDRQIFKDHIVEYSDIQAVKEIIGG